MAKKEEKEKKKVESILDLQFESFCDAFAWNYKKGVFLLDFGQAAYEPIKMIARIWIDIDSLKELVEFLQEGLKQYEKKFGKTK